MDADESGVARGVSATLRSIPGRIIRLPRWFGLCLIKFYQCCISPRFPACCRYVPTCSQYALIAVERFGLFKGSWLALKRIMRCHPFHEGGYDPVPETFSFFAKGRPRKCKK